MRVVGKEKSLAVTGEPSFANLVAADHFMTMLRGLAGGMRYFYPRGVYRYPSHEEADAAWVDAVAHDMALLEEERQDGTGKIRS
jgi:hypothetical protein